MRPERKESSPVDPTRQYLAPLRDYAETARKLFPESEPAPDSSSFSASDALFLGYFLERLPREAIVLEIGSSGASTLWFAAHRGVSRVECVVQNTRVEGPDGVRIVVGEYPAEREKVHFHEVSPESLAETLRAMDLPETGDGLVVFIDDQRTRKSVAESLSAVLNSRPEATMLLSGCRRESGPYVQAGVADFLERSGDQYRFRLAGDLGPALSGSGIGVLYPVAGAAGMEKTLGEVARTFSRKLDPLRLLGREEELMNTVSKVNRQLTRANEQRDRLQKQVSRSNKEASDPEAGLMTELKKQRARNARLISHYSSRRYKVADFLVGGLKKLLVIERLIRRNPPSSGGD